MRKLLALCVFLCAATLLVNGCSRIPQTNSSAPTSSNPASAPTSSNPASAGNATDPEYWAQNGIAYPTNQLQVGSVYTDKEVGFQLEQPQAGEQIAIMHTSMGDIYIRFFPEAAPKAVENFLTHAQNGYYDGLTFHRVINDFMIQSGDPNGNSTGGQSIWGEDFEDEFDSKLLNLRGSLSMSNNGPNSNGSQFFINQGDADSFAGRAELESNYKINMQQLFAQFDKLLSQIRAQYEAYPQYQQYFPTLNDFFWIQLINYIVPNTDIVSEEIWALYEQYGGNIALDGATRFRGGHTVFGQVFRGMDVVDAIAGVAVDSNDKPLTDVIIHSIDVVTDWQ